MNKQQEFRVFKPDYEIERSKIENFLITFVDKNIRQDPLHDQRKYMIQLQGVSDRKLKVIEIYFEDLDYFFSRENDTQLCELILQNTSRYVKIFSEAIDRIMPKRSIRLREEDSEAIEDTILNQRISNIENNADGKPKGTKTPLPPEILRRYQLFIIPGPGSKANILPLRSLKSEQVGSVVSITAIVVKASDVKPFIRVASYACDTCGHELYQTISSPIYMPLVDCTSSTCKNNQTRGKIYPMTRASKFVAYQELKVQEPTHQVPIGHVPRSLSVYALGECVKQCSPGDLITIHGIYLPTINNNSNLPGSALIHNTFIEAFKIIKHKLSYKDTEISNDMISQIEVQKKRTPDIYSALAKSIAPEIYGMEDIKKALLLLLVGGVTKEMPDGMKIRGNINILLMGDPGVAKSQLLKHLAHISPRGVYTTGKGSSGVGLTAAIVKDPVTNDLTLEGGALVLADMGICCIDEFDKMSDYDRANIHEVMEQQTVSIAKAGITTRLNARASVLAAANPIYGKYNKKLTPQQNINLPAALLSRFDLIFLLLDKAEIANDEMLASHVTYVHQHLAPPKLDFDPLSASFIRAYIAEAKKCEPIIPKDLHNFLIQKYVEKRKQESELYKDGHQYVTPRTLLGVIRLAQGLARLRFNDEVEQIDIDEAIRLSEFSRSMINDDVATSNKISFNVKGDAISTVFLIIREMCFTSKDKSVKIEDVERKIANKNLNKQHLLDCITQYQNLDILYVDKNMTEITLI